MNLKLNLFFLFFNFFLINFVNSQDLNDTSNKDAYVPKGTLIDEINAFVGDEIILKSEIESRFNQMQKEEGNYGIDRCNVIEQILTEKLMIHRAYHDSIVVTESEIIDQIEHRLKYFIKQIGSEERLEKYYGKTMAQIKEDFKEIVREQTLTQKLQQKIFEGTNISPNEIKTFFNKIPEDSLPLINTEVEIQQILIKVTPNENQKQKAKEELYKIRQRILEGADFGTMAVLYSEDPGSAKKKGELGFVSRGSLVKEYQSVAFSIEPNFISEPFETEYGFHIVETLERRGELINTRHILIRPDIDQNDIDKVNNILDTIYKKLINNEISFKDAVLKYSEDIHTYQNEGFMISQNTGEKKIDIDELDSKLYIAIKDLEVNQISQPEIYEDKQNKYYGRILRLANKIPPHKVSINTDYSKIKEFALQEKQQKSFSKWISNNILKSYIKIADVYKNCKFRFKWIENEQ